MNVRQQLYKKYRLDGYSKYTSARKAGYTHNTAIQAKNIEKYIKDMDYWLERRGLTDDKLAEHAEEGLTANRVISAIKGTQATGQTCDFIDIPDWQIRHKYLETILKLRKKLSDKTIVDQSIHTYLTKVNIKISDDTAIPLTRKAGVNTSG